MGLHSRLYNSVLVSLKGKWSNKNEYDDGRIESYNNMEIIVIEYLSILSVLFLY